MQITETDRTGAIVLAENPRLLVLETSSRQAQIALAEGLTVVESRQLAEARRHARDLVPTLAALLAARGWRPRDLQGIIVSRGPGSYTGLRVGIMSAKTLAYAAGIPLVAVDTFAAVAAQAPLEARHVEVWADAQQGRVYAQTFARPATQAALAPETSLVITPVAERISSLDATCWLTGPGLERYETQLPQPFPCVTGTAREPQPESLLTLGLIRLRAGERDDPFGLEPLYLRPSSAEEQWQKLGRA